MSRHETPDAYIERRPEDGPQGDPAGDACPVCERIDCMCPEECPNCGRKLIDCCGNCIFDDLPNKGFSDLSAALMLADPIRLEKSYGVAEARESKEAKPEQAIRNQDSCGGAQTSLDELEVFSDLTAVPVLAEPSRPKLESVMRETDKGGEARESTQNNAAKSPSYGLAGSHGGSQTSLDEPEGLAEWYDEQEARWQDKKELEAAKARGETGGY